MTFKELPGCSRMTSEFIPSDFAAFSRFLSKLEFYPPRSSVILSIYRRFRLEFTR